MNPWKLYITAAVVIILVLAVILDLLARRRERRRQQRTPAMLLKNAHSCMVHNHWVNVVEKNRAARKANTLPAIDKEARL